MTIDELPGADERRTHANRILDDALRFLVDHDMASFAALWAPDGVFEIPFAPGGPTRLEGQPAVASYVAHYTSIVDVRALTSERRHHTLDPDTIVLEFETDCVVVATGAPLHMQYIAVITVGEQGITSYRDFWNPMLAAQALGAASPLARGTVAGDS